MEEIQDKKNKIIQAEKIILSGRSIYYPNVYGYLSRFDYSGYIGNDEIILLLMESTAYPHFSLKDSIYNPERIPDLDVNSKIIQLLQLEDIPINYTRYGTHYMDYAVRQPYCNDTPLSFSLKYAFDQVATRLLEHPKIDVNYKYIEGSESFPPVATLWRDFRQQLLLKDVYLKLLSHPELKLNPTDFCNIYKTLMNYCTSNFKQNIVESSMKTIEILRWLQNNNNCPDTIRSSAENDVSKIKKRICNHIMEN